MRKIAKEQFVLRCTEVHEGKYDYSKVRLCGMTKLIRIRCQIHGYFQQIAIVHQSGYGCPKCGILQRSQNRLRSKAFALVQDFIAKHGDRYDYSELRTSDYKGAHKKVPIRCYEHGLFWMSATNHKSGQGCPECGNIKRRQQQKLSPKEFFRKAKEKYPHLDFSQTKYQRWRKAIEVRCPEHGFFTTSPDNLLYGRRLGCKLCSHQKLRLERSIDSKQVILRAQAAHPDGQYDFSLIEYRNNRTPVQVICRKHGPFLIRPEILWLGYGCPKCDQRYGNRWNIEPNRKAILYFIELTFPDGRVLNKIGFTTNTVDIRFKCLRGKRIGFSVLHAVTKRFAEVFKLERKILRACYKKRLLAEIVSADVIMPLTHQIRLGEIGGGESECVSPAAERLIRKMMSSTETDKTTPDSLRTPDERMRGVRGRGSGRASRTR